MSIDAQVAADDKKASHAFTFTNAGDAPVAIERVKSSCRCTSAKLGDKQVYAPGEVRDDAPAKLLWATLAS